MSDTKTIPTGPGAYYLANGQPAVAWWSCGGLLFRADAESTTWADAPTATWATGPDGEPVRVPTLGEWGEAVGQVQASDWWRNRANELVIEQNAAKQDAHQARAERDEARAALAEVAAVGEAHNALLSALGVPEGVDAVDWAGALVALSGAAMALVAATDSESGQAVALLGLREALEALHATRPMPDGPGDWWGRYGRHELRAVHVCWRSGDLVGVAHRQSRPDAAWVDVKSDRWTWLAGPDGKAVRCTPPEVTRD